MSRLRLGETWIGRRDPMGKMEKMRIGNNSFHSFSQTKPVNVIIELTCGPGNESSNMAE